MTEEKSPIVKSKILRAFLIIVGFISFGLGTVGIFLPILPTTPLYLLTSFCFLKSSKRFNTWFLNSKLYKKHLENFAKNKAMIIYNEIFLLLAVSTMLMCTIYFVNNLTVTIILTLLIACKYAYFVFYVRPITKKEFNEMMEERKRKELERENVTLTLEGENE